MAETNGNEAATSSTIERVSAHAQQSMARIHAEQYRLGRLLCELMDGEQAQVGTYKDARKHLGAAAQALADADLTRARKAARWFTEDVCVKYGARRLNLLVEYARKSREHWMEGDPGPTPIQVPCESGALRQKPFAECTVEELGKAFSAARRLPEIPKPAPRLEEYCIHLLREGIRKRFNALSPVCVNAFASGGRMHVTLKIVSVRELRMLADAIRDAIAPLHVEMYRRALKQRSRLDSLATAPRAP